ncbi:MAG: SH3 domain-containing protein [Anaerolineae bacterium]|nr:SH3 domain-containing protein [Anaerolineae bacterium]
MVSLKHRTHFIIVAIFCSLLAAGIQILAQTAPTPVPTAGVLVVLSPPPTMTPLPTATETPLVTATCADQIVSLYVAATEACINKPAGYVCNAGSPLAAEPQGGVSSALAALGALVDVQEVDAVSSAAFVPENSQAGIAYIRPVDPLLYSAFLLGDVQMRDVSPADFPAWTSFIVETSPEHPACLSAPAPVVILQTQLGYGVRIVVNTISLFLNGTALVKTDEETTTFVLLSGVASALANGSEVAFNVGQQVTVAHAPGDVSVPVSAPGQPVPYDPALVIDLPIALFDRPILLPQPGYVITQGAVNLRVNPNTDAGVIVQVPAGEVLSVLGRNPAGDWLNVRRDNGESGWMFSDLLARSLGEVSAVYTLTPLPPQRFGELGRHAQIIGIGGVPLRAGPDQIFPFMTALSEGQDVVLLARSPYSPWVKIDVGGAVGWVPLLALQTQAYIDALPVDYQAPNIPTPTIEPGSFGNAFPDPDNP